jgi:hypothetical protein
VLVQGRANTDLLLQDDPKSERNRHISIGLRRDNPCLSECATPMHPANSAHQSQL